MVRAVGIALSRLARRARRCGSGSRRRALSSSASSRTTAACSTGVEEQRRRPEGAASPGARDGRVLRLARLGRGPRGAARDHARRCAPCTWSYADIAVRAREGPGRASGLRGWVGFFAGDDYASAIAARTAALDELLAPLSEAPDRGLSELFTMGTRLEHLFWDMAYGLRAMARSIEGGGRMKAALLYEGGDVAGRGRRGSRSRTAGRSSRARPRVSAGPSSTSSRA